MQGPCYLNRTNHFKYTSHIRRGSGDFVVNCFLYLGGLGKGLTSFLTKGCRHDWPIYPHLLLHPGQRPLYCFRMQMQAVTGLALRNIQKRAYGIHLKLIKKNEIVERRSQYDLGTPKGLIDCAQKSPQEHHLT